MQTNQAAAAAEPTADEKAEELARLIKKSRSGKKWRWIFLALFIIGIVVLIIKLVNTEPEKPSWVTEPLGRGDMVLTATATGDLNPRRTVTIGAENSGQILSVEVEANDHVTKGQVLLRFDTEALDNALVQANASLASAQANQRGAQATLDAAEVDYNRTATLAEKNMASKSALDQRLADKLRAVSSLESAKANVARARAEVASAKTRLSKAIITSPIDGVVMTQNVESGNTVASSFSTPELFVLAEDLSQMTLKIEVDEADIGLVEPGQKATFDVDAWPGKKFDAEVRTVSLSPTVDQNVVTYAVELMVDNSDGLLRPGMTATATITTGVHENILRVSNAALRFSPDADADPSGQGRSIFRFGPPSGRRGGGAESAAKSVWVLRAGELEEVPVDVGPSDGRFTEVTPLNEDELKDGDAIVLRQQTISKDNKNGKDNDRKRPSPDAGASPRSPQENGSERRPPAPGAPTQQDQPGTQDDQDGQQNPDRPARGGGA